MTVTGLCEEDCSLWRLAMRIEFTKFIVLRIAEHGRYLNDARGWPSSFKIKGNPNDFFSCNLLCVMLCFLGGTFGLLAFAFLCSNMAAKFLTVPLGTVGSV